MLVWLAGAWSLGGCAGGAGSTGPSVTLPGDRYAEAFRETRNLLLGQGFVLERVDAREGVITTRAKGTAGLATPWDREQASLRHEMRDTLNRHQRAVRVEFTAAEPPPPESGPRSPASVEGLEEPAGASRDDGSGEAFEPPVRTTMRRDLRSYQGPVVATFRVTIERVQRPGFRPEPASIRLSPMHIDPDLRDRGMWPQHAVPIGRDHELERRLARRLHQRLGVPAPEASER
ncbi:MAG: hypothetical protein EA378_06015 [Phycisphaerales bacterium]|nr:MAG: hypothetical protein EA378_06015 [Phycisphaerales bacterium]